jgi:ABC-type lipoprotein release transport system permease subunit
VLRSLIYYRRLHFAVALGAAVTTAVLTGALLVGDSVRGSLRDLSLERLGKIDFAVISEHLFRQNLSGELSQQPGFLQQFGDPASSLLLNGNVTHGSSQTRAVGVNICGVDQHFFELFDEDSAAAYTQALARKAGQPFAPVVINESLRRELDARIGDQVLLSFKSYADIPRASVLGRKNAEDLTESVRLTIARILPDRGVGRFGLRTQQYLPFNAFVSLPVLQRTLRRPAEINALLVPAKNDSAFKLAGDLGQALHNALRVEDTGVRVQEFENYFSLTSRELILKPELVTHAQVVATELDLATQTLLTYLANTMRANSRQAPYSTITALRTPMAAAFGELKLTNGVPVEALGDDEILLNDWAAQDLSAQIGDTVTLSYYVVNEREQLLTRHHAFRVKGVVAMAGIAADRNLAPSIPGVDEKENMQDWEPPFPVDLNLIRPQDEKYWDEYRATPKAFVSEKAGRSLWRSRFGEVNAVRFAPAAKEYVSEARRKFEQALLHRLTPPQAGFVIQPVKAQSLQSSEGATDFGGLFIGFSLFLIVSAVLLVGMLFRLGVEQRAKEIGLRLATGHTLRAVRWRFLREGLIVSGTGVALGVIGAVGYAAMMIAALRTWWVDAVGTSFLFLHAGSKSLALGAILSLAIIVLAIVLTIRHLRKIPATALLHGVTARDQHAPPRFARLIAGIALALSMVLIVAAFWQGGQDTAGIFFGSGALALISGLAFFSAWMHKRRTEARLQNLLHMAMRNTGRQSGRSMLSAALVGCACFMIVAVGANRRDLTAEIGQRNSGTGGFALLAETDTPLSQDLNSPAGRSELGFADEDSSVFGQTQIYPFRMLPGEDASCLNLYKPQKPRVLGITKDGIARDGFRFQAALERGGTNPWQLLGADLGSGVIPAVGDYNSVQWILHLGLSKDLEIQNERGENIKLRFVGLLHSSIFQSEIIISEENFLRHFPGQSGYSYFLIDAPPEDAAPGDRTARIAQACESTLSIYGFDATSTLDKLAKFQAVENTYLSVFAVLGGLGLLLGTLGLGIILTRNIIERRGELATLRAFGYRRSALARMLLAENGFLILCGLAIGSAAALLAVAPHLFSQGAQIPWPLLGGILLLVGIVGLLASAVALSFSFRVPLLPALKAE